MNFSHLPSPGIINCGHELRKVATKAISAAEIRKDQSGLTSPALVAFFQAALSATPGYVDPGAPNPAEAKVTNGQTLTFNGTEFTFTVVAGAITSIVVAEQVEA